MITQPIRRTNRNELFAWEAEQQAFTRPHSYDVQTDEEYECWVVAVKYEEPCQSLDLYKTAWGEE